MNREEYIGLVVEIPNIGRGQIRYIGSVEMKEGIFAGIDLYSGNGKNDGTFKGRKYFQTTFPRSGLFIQWEKVSNLIPQQSNGGSNGRTLHSLSPTPVRGMGNPILNQGSEHSQQRKTSVTELGPSFRASTEYSSKLIDTDRMEAELFQYKRMVEDQRIVLEEIQAAIDEYETKLESTEREKLTLQRQLEHERASHERQKQFYENEHDQLLTVIHELQTEINRNAAILSEIMEREKNMDVDVRNELTNYDNSQNMTDLSVIDDLKAQLHDLQQYKNQAELYKTKWEKEKEQLKLHNQSLSKEYQNVSNELLECQKKLHTDENKQNSLEKELDEARKTIDSLQAQLQVMQKKQEQQNVMQIDDNMETLPLYNPTVEQKGSVSLATAGRSLWCALCEKDGHESVDCPYDDKFF